MAVTGTAQATIGLDYSAFEKGAKAVMDLASRMGSVVQTALGVAIGEIGAGAITRFAGAIPAAIENTLKLGEEMANMAHATGMAAGQYYIFKTALEKGLTIQDASAFVGKNADILTRSAAGFRDAAIRLSEIGERIKGFWLGMAEKILPALNAIFDKLQSFDFSAWGAKLGDAFESAFEVLYGLAQDGKIWEAAALTLQVGVAEANNAMIYGATVFVSILGTFFATLPDLLGSALLEASSKSGQEFIKGFLKGFSGVPAASAFASDVTSGVKLSPDGVLAAIKAVPFEDKAGAAKFQGLLQQLLDSSRQTFEKTPKPPGFENRTAIQNFGVSNLQKLGLGGTVNGPGGVSLSDYAKESLSEEKAIRLAVETIARQGASLGGKNYESILETTLSGKIKID